MLRKMLAILVIALSVMTPSLAMSQQATLASTPPTALSSETAREFINDLGARTITALKTQSITAQERSAELGLILLDGVDFDTIAMHTLGRYARRPDSKEFQEFSTLFAAYIIDIAVEKFGTMPIESYSIVSTTPTPNGDVVVNTTVAAGGAPINAGWRVRMMNGAPKIIDIVVDGYSMTTHFAGQYQDWLGKAGLEGLVSKMRGQTKNSLSLVVVRAMRG